MTDAQWARARRLRRIADNRARRDERRRQRLEEPGFRAVEAQRARDYRARRSGRCVWEITRCRVCKAHWARLRESEGQKQSTCPTCRKWGNMTKTTLHVTASEGLLDNMTVLSKATKIPKSTLARLILRRETERLMDLTPAEILREVRREI